MNKYTLEFKYKSFEDEYQQQRIHTISIPVFKFGSACILVVATLKLITLVLQNQLDLVPILIACQVYTLLSFLFLHFKIHKINIQLILLAYILIAYELIIKTDTSPQALSLYQSNFTMCGVIIILISEFKESLVIIISTFLFKIIYTMVVETQKSYLIYFSTLFLMLFMCFFSYKLNTLNRTSFLLSQYDYMWESVFPKIVDNPYIIFSFSEDKLEFLFKSQSKMPFECNNSKQLKTFLREWNYNLESLENTFYKLYQNQALNEFHSKRIEITKDCKNKQYIRYSMMKSISSTFIIKFDDSVIKVDDCKIIMKKMIKNSQQLRMELIKSIYKNLQKSLNSKFQDNLWQMRNSCLKQILNFKILKNRLKTQQFDMENLLFLNEFFGYKFSRLIVFNPKNDKITTIVIQLKRLFFEILEAASHQSQVDVQILDTVTVSYEGREINQKKDSLLKSIWNTLVERVERKNNRWLIQLYKEPQVNFTDQQYTSK
ncbi:unnamed protein product [Paramecium sonneborni]|uniref:Transmembrane protein n=1 Tax=Paramecium sonneborni TaxID=65129 RepID=A0A8S1M236_9CILI|nr:unnamed protein product [Paramecium sonneborni]